MARRVVEGAGLETSTDGFDFNTLRKIAQFCQRLMAESKPTKDAIEKCRSMAENVGNVEVVAGAITRHIKFSSGSKQLLCWYLLDSLSKTHPDTFCLSFGPQVQELAIHHMNWLNPKDELKYSKLVDTWKTLFGLRVCEEILRGKEVRKAEHELEEKEKAERKAKGEPEEEEQAKKQWDTKEMIIGRVEDGQVMERIAPCKYYLLGICNSANCTQPHPPGLFGSINPKKIFGDWVCLKCGFKNVGSRVKCWRNECTGVKPEHNGINLQSLQKNPLKEQFGYDIGWGDEEDEKGNEPAVEHYSNTNWEEYRAERMANYKGLWTRWSNTRRKLDPSFADRGTLLLFPPPPLFGVKSSHTYTQTPLRRPASPATSARHPSRWERRSAHNVVRSRRPPRRPLPPRSPPRKVSAKTCSSRRRACRSRRCRAACPPPSRSWSPCAAALSTPTTPSFWTSSCRRCSSAKTTPPSNSSRRSGHPSSSGYRFFSCCCLRFSPRARATQHATLFSLTHRPSPPATASGRRTRAPTTGRPTSFRLCLPCGSLCPCRTSTRVYVFDSVFFFPPPFRTPTHAHNQNRSSTAWWRRRLPSRSPRLPLLQQHRARAQSRSKPHGSQHIFGGMGQKQKKRKQTKKKSSYSQHQLHGVPLGCWYSRAICFFHLGERAKEQETYRILTQLRKKKLRKNKTNTPLTLPSHFPLSAPAPPSSSRSTRVFLQSNHRAQRRLVRQVRLCLLHVTCPMI